jgi:hypothetical protein
LFYRPAQPVASAQCGKNGDPPARPGVAQFFGISRPGLSARPDIPGDCGGPRVGVCSGGMEGDVTQVLDAAARGEPGAADRLLPLVYAELRRLAARKLAHERPGQTLDATALVHEAYLRLVDQRGRGSAPGGHEGR